MMPCFENKPHICCNKAMDAMKPVKIGILSDTHLARPTAEFRIQINDCFADVSVIFHAGDLTDISILDAFSGKTIHAVHGNMCHSSSWTELPEEKIVTIGNYTIAMTHGMKYPRSQIEDRLLERFPEADCIIYGHTHEPVCHMVGSTLLINPGCFGCTSRYGAPGTFAILELGTTLNGVIHAVPYK